MVLFDMDTVFFLSARLFVPMQKWPYDLKVILLWWGASWERIHSDGPSEDKAWTINWMYIRSKFLVQRSSTMMLGFENDILCLPRSSHPPSLILTRSVRRAIPPKRTLRLCSYWEEAARVGQALVAFSAGRGVDWLQGSIKGETTVFSFCGGHEEMRGIGRGTLMKTSIRHVARLNRVRPT